MLLEKACKPTIIVNTIKVYKPKFVKLILKFPKIGAVKLNNEYVSNWSKGDKIKNDIFK